jgi:hypothetical protein
MTEQERVELTELKHIRVERPFLPHETLRYNELIMKLATEFKNKMRKFLFVQNQIENN